MPSESGDAAAPGPPSEKPETSTEDTTTKSKETVQLEEQEQTSGSTANVPGQQPAANGGQAQTQDGAGAGRGRRPTKGQEPFSQAERDEMEKLLQELRGHLGEWDYSLRSLPP